MDFEERRTWQCPAGCCEPYWSHQLYGHCDDNGDEQLKCPPPLEGRDCCGRLPEPANDEVRACSRGNCDAWWCLCGTFTGMSAGPVHCGCEYDRGEVSTDSLKRSS